MLTALYIHIPFCKKICTYCDFHKEMATPQKQEHYIDALVRELALVKEQLTTIKTIFIGGGTPSSLDNNVLTLLLKRIKEVVSFDSLEEYTIETNPNDINEVFVDTILQYGINRVSIGVQTFQAKHLTFIGRTHTVADIHSSVRLLREKGVTNISVDMMFALIDQTMEELQDDIKKVIALNVDHISYYSLILEEKTTLYHLYKKGKIALPSEDLEGDMYETVITSLQEAGFDHYEISNFSKDGKVSKHNLVYWNNEDYLGVGTGSHSHITDKRFYHTKNISAYIEQITEHNTVAQYEESCDNMAETLLVGLRLRKGVSISKFTTLFGADMFEYYPALKEFITTGILEITDGHLRFTTHGLFIGNEVFELFVEEETC